VHIHYQAVYMHVQYINCTLFTLWFEILIGFQECSTHIVIDLICLRDIIPINILWTYFKGMIDMMHMYMYTKNRCIKSLIWSAFNNMPCIFFNLGIGRGFIYICWPNLIQSHLNHWRNTVWIKKGIARYIYTCAWVYYFPSLIHDRFPIYM
jgi:hypothetical protein